MTRKQRLLKQIRGEPVDRIPMLGGWNLGVKNLAAIAGLSVEKYLNDPFRGVIQANLALGVDAVVPPIVPVDIAAIRDGSIQESSFKDVVPEALKARADAIPGDEGKVLARFDPAAAERDYRAQLDSLLPKLGAIELLPTFWLAPANFALYFQYGYEAFLSATALYPDEVGRIFWEDGLLARERNRILVRLMKEYDLIPMLFTGHDICNGSGPMCSPAFLRKQYFPNMKMSLEPFVEAGVRVIGHCDGNIMPLIDDMIAAGMSGFQGFQYEFGVDPCDIDQRRSARGEKLLYFTGLSVTCTLPLGSVRDVEEEVDYFLDFTDGGKRMFLFTSNVTGVDVPPRNIIAAYRHLSACVPPIPSRRVGVRPEWPWRLAHPG